MAGDDRARGGDAQDLLGRWLAHHDRQPTDDEPSAPAAPEPVRPLEDTIRAAVAACASATTSVHPALRSAPEQPVVREEMPSLYTFRPRRTARRTMTLVLLGALAVTAYAVHAAWEARDTASIGLAAIAGVATAIVWAIRAGTSPAELVVRQGQLEVTRQGERHVFDLSGTFTLIEVRGRPGRRGWQAVFPRRGTSSFTVDASMVDPHDFMRVLRFHRPNPGA